jgi:hypothetical protein
MKFLKIKKINLNKNHLNIRNKKAKKKDARRLTSCNSIAAWWRLGYEKPQSG